MQKQISDLGVGDWVRSGKGQTACLDGSVACPACGRQYICWPHHHAHLGWYRGQAESQAQNAYALIEVVATNPAEGSEKQKSRLGIA